MHADIIHALKEFERLEGPFHYKTIFSWTVPDQSIDLFAELEKLKLIINTTLTRLPIPQRIQNIQEIISFIDGGSDELQNHLFAFKMCLKPLLNKLIQDQLTKSEFTDYEKHVKMVVSIAGKRKSKAAREFMWQYGRKKCEKPDLNRADYIRELAFEGNIDSAYRWMDEYNNVDKMLLDGQ